MALGGEASAPFEKLQRLDDAVEPLRRKWASVLVADKRVCFVAETKSTLDEQLRRDVKNMKIKCGRTHFALFSGEGVMYDVVTSKRQMLDIVEGTA